MHISKLFYFCLKKRSSTWLIPASLCEGPFFYFYVESVFLFLLYPSSNHLVSTSVQFLLHIIFISNRENFVLTLSWDNLQVEAFCWKLKSSFVLAKLLCWTNIALWDINIVKCYSFKSLKYSFLVNSCLDVYTWLIIVFFMQ